MKNYVYLKSKLNNIINQYEFLYAYLYVIYNTKIN